MKQSFQNRVDSLFLNECTRQWRYSLLTVLLATTSVSHALTLNESIQLALLHESQLKIGELNVQQQQAVVNQAKAQDQLYVNFVGKIGREKTVTPEWYNLPLEGTRDPRSAEIQFNYPIYTSGRHALRVDSAQSQYTAALFGVEDLRSQTIYRTVQAYTDVLRNQALLTLEARVSANLQQALKDAQSRFNANVITRADLAQAKSQYAQGKANYVQRQANLRISQTLFFQLTGHAATDLQKVKRLPKVPSTLDEALANIENHPALIKAKHELKAAEQQYNLVRRELWPTVAITSRAAVQNETILRNSRNESYAIGLQATLPLYDGGLNHANRQKSLSQVDLTREKVSALRESLQQNIEATFTQLNATKENQLAIKEALASATIALDFIKKELEFGSKTTFDLLTAEQTLRTIEAQRILNQQDQIVLSYQLLNQTGQLNNAP